MTEQALARFTLDAIRARLEPLFLRSFNDGLDPYISLRSCGTLLAARLLDLLPATSTHRRRLCYKI